MTEIAPLQKPRSRGGALGDWRLILLMACFCLSYLAVAVQMGFLAATDPVEPSLARSESKGRPVRGEIVDVNGRLLAANLPAWSLYAYPREIKDPVAMATALGKIFPGIDREVFLGKLAGRQKFVWLKRPITPREKQAVHDLGFPGIFFGNREMRIYPAGRVVAHIVGSVKAATEGVRFAEFTGAGGIEQHFDDRLSDPALAGEPLRLSLDLTVQHAIREELERGMKWLTAKGATAILMRVATGEIVGMVSLPDFDPNTRPVRYTGDPAFAPRFNRAAQGRYELGSVFKVLTAAIALETRVASASTIITIPAKLRVGRFSISDSHRMAPEMSLEDVIVKSSNVGAAKIALMIGTPRFKEYLGALGLFEPSGLELSEAVRARALLPDRWTDLSTMTISYGHGIAVSPVHLASAFATIANGGVQVLPSLVAGGVPNGERVFSQETSREMVRIMRQVVVRGTAGRADVAGYEVGGKTGTADKAGPGGYVGDQVISTFASVFPTSRPEYVLIVSLDEPIDRTGPRPVRTAGRTAVPVAARIIRRVAPLMGMRPIEGRESGAVAALGVRTE